MAAALFATGYFPEPWEMHADAMRDYRGHREELLEKNPQLYWIARNEDQKEINHFYGVDENGEPNYIRGIDGGLVKNTPQIQWTVMSWENEVMGIGSTMAA